MASHIALEETGQPYELQETLISKDAHKTPEYLAVNPRGKVPALVVDDKVITENTAILTYIGRGFPQPACCRRTDRAVSRHFADGVVLQHAAHLAARNHAALPFRLVRRRITKTKETGRRTYWRDLQEIDELIGNRKWADR